MSRSILAFSLIFSLVVMADTPDDEFRGPSVVSLIRKEIQGVTFNLVVTEHPADLADAYLVPQSPEENLAVSNQSFARQLYRDAYPEGFHDFTFQLTSPHFRKYGRIFVSPARPSGNPILLHAVMIGKASNATEILARSLKNALDAAEEHNVRSLAIPLLGISPQLTLSILLDHVTQMESSLREIVMVGNPHKAEAYLEFETVLKLAPSTIPPLRDVFDFSKEGEMNRLARLDAIGFSNVKDPATRKTLRLGEVISWQEQKIERRALEKMCSRQRELYVRARTRMSIEDAIGRVMKK